MRKKCFTGLLILLLLLMSFFTYQYLSTVLYACDVVVYGGGLAGCASARNAASLAPEKKVLLIVPEPGEKLGGIGTVGGQNFADIRYWRQQLVTAGSFQRWFEQSGQFYNTPQMAEIIRADLAQFPNLTVIYQHDLKKVKKWGSRIKALLIAPVVRDAKGYVQWAKGWKIVWGTVFIDASAEGRLVRLADNQLVVGRQDWPLKYLPAEEVTGKWTRQQAATLMFKVTGVKKPIQPGQLGDLHFVIDARGSWGLVGGKETWQNDPVVRRFNESYGSRGFALKPLNAAQDGAGSNEWWVNMLLIFDVDGRAREKDRGGDNFPELGVGQKTVDQAWQEARELLTKPDFLEALRRFAVTDQGQRYGLGEVTLVKDVNNQPVVGEVLYLRETVHSPWEGERRDGEMERLAGNENTSFALTTRAAQEAGEGLGKADSNADKAADEANYEERIGLGYYMMDVNAFMFQDLVQNGRYVWPVTGYLRPDWQEAGGQPSNPVYLPYAVLKATGSPNLLVPGYAAGCSSLAWSELRVLPNLTVLGDAAGVAAARAVLFKEEPADFAAEQIKWVQGKLRERGARLDK